MLIHEPIVQLLCLYMAFVYGLLYCVYPESSQSHAVLYISVYITTIPSIFQDVYHDRIGIAGLHYLAFGVGLTGGSQINAMFIDRVYMWLKSRNGGVGKPEFRLRTYQCSILFLSPEQIILLRCSQHRSWTILIPTGLLITGWAAQRHVFWLALDVVCGLKLHA